jgi:replicative DNA helicase
MAKTKTKNQTIEFPHNIEAERALIGACMNDKNSIPVMLDIISAEMFYSPRLRMLFENIVNMWGEGKSVDFITLSDFTGNPELTEELMTCHNSFVSSASTKYYAEIILEKYRLRQIVSHGGAMMRQAQSEDDSHDIIETFTGAIIKIQSRTDDPDMGKEINAISDFIDRKTDYNFLIGQPSGLRDLDEKTLGFCPTEVTVIAGRPGHGKSSLIVNISRAVLERGESVGIISLEMDARSMAERFIAQEGKINLRAIRTGHIHHNDKAMQEYSRACGVFSQYMKRLKFDNTSHAVQTISAKAHLWKMKNDIKILFIDYLQLIDHRETGTTSDNIGNSTRAIKYLAMKLNIPIILLSQLTRENVRDERKPRLSDLRSSGSIEQDANNVIFIHHEFDTAHKEDMMFITQSELLIRKQRQGMTGDINVLYRPEFTLFENVKRIQTPNGLVQTPVPLRTDQGGDVW